MDAVPPEPKFYIVLSYNQYTQTNRVLHYLTEKDNQVDYWDWHEENDGLFTFESKSYWNGDPWVNTAFRSG